MVAATELKHVRENIMLNNKVCVLPSKLRGLSPRANYTDRAAAAGRRSSALVSLFNLH